MNSFNDPFYLKVALILNWLISSFENLFFIAELSRQTFHSSESLKPSTFINWEN